MDIMISKDNKKIEKNELLFSEIVDSFDHLNKNLNNKKDIYKNNVEKMMINKINKKFTKNKNKKSDYNGKLMDFSINDSLVNENLKSQKEMLDSKIFMRKQKKIIQSNLKRFRIFSKTNKKRKKF